MSARLRLLLAFGLLLATVGASPAAGLLPDPTTPAVAFAVKSGDVTLVEWTPGAQAPDYYAVYGYDDPNAPSLLATVSGNAEPRAEVSAGFAGYSVSAITGNAESPAILALTANLPCITFDPGPPPSGAVGCPIGIGGRVKLETLLVGLP